MALRELSPRLGVKSFAQGSDVIFFSKMLIGSLVVKALRHPSPDVKILGQLP